MYEKDWKGPKPSSFASTRSQSVQIWSTQKNAVQLTNQFFHHCFKLGSYQSGLLGLSVSNMSNVILPNRQLDRGSKNTIKNSSWVNFTWPAR